MNDYQKLAAFALELISQAAVPARSPSLENTMATRAWLNDIVQGKLSVVRFPDADIQPDKPEAA